MILLVAFAVSAGVVVAGALLAAAVSRILRRDRIL